MALLLGCQGVSKSWGSAPLFRDLAFGIEEGDRIGMVGPNGCGKSTLLDILAGIEEPDTGAVSLRRLTRLAHVPQHPRFAAGLDVAGVVEEPLAASGLGPVERSARALAMLARCGFDDTDTDPARLSGGWQKRLAIARALVIEPDLLLLDEPTNHLDLEGILWLEELLTSQTSAFVVVSHDRWFLEHVAARMFDLDPVHPGGFFETRAGFSEFLLRKEAALHEQQRSQATLANRVRREVEWWRRGPKARTTKSQARIDQAGRAIEQLAETSARLDRRTATVSFAATDRRTRRLVVAEGISKSFDDRLVVADASFVLMPGTRLGVLGPNGSGKSTLLRLVTGALQPDSGRLERADDLRIALLDQHRTALDPSLTLRRALAPEGDQVIFAGKPVHVVGWAQRFLFRPEHLSMPVGKLSGGEQARVHLARLMLEPADLLILDEPTNDLDIPTLEVLEESLLEFPGAVVLVTHDRYLFETVATTVLALDGSGAVTALADYAQWEEARRAATARATTAPAPESAKTDAAVPVAKSKPGRLGYMEQREFDGMEAAIGAAEEVLRRAREAAEDPSVATRADELARRCQALEQAQTAVDVLYARWAELEEKRGG
jgi:ATP-binding cassette subfamily F protein uup